MTELKSIIHSDPEIHVFLDNYPSVSREQALAFLEAVHAAQL
ncbi:MAG TPA: hypothetical protein VGF48_26065 [Thermoanaerobaculia bacterium]|jgi:uncharacterized protein (DUF433 family)